MTRLEFDEAWLADWCKRTGKPNPLEGGTTTQPVKDKAKRRKYGNKPTEVDGRTFDSKREANRYRELMTLLRAGEILGVFCQHPFRLPGGVVYRADFVVLNRDGTFTVEDAKGVRTKEYAIKARQMKACLGIEVREV